MWMTRELSPAQLPPNLASADWDRGACPCWRFQGRKVSTSTCFLGGGISGEDGSAREETLEVMCSSVPMA